MFTRPRRGVASKNGKLYIFSNCRICVLKPWPELAAWTRSKGKPWQRFRPGLDLRAKSVSAARPTHRFTPKQAWPRRADEAANPALLEDAGEAAVFAHMRAEPLGEFADYCEREASRERALIEDFTASIPAEVRSLVERFPARHWHLLCMLARCDGSLEILRDNPALGFAMASCWTFADVRSGRAMGWIRRRIPKRRRDIAGDLGFPNRESVVRILAKLPPGDCSVRSLLSLRDRLADPTSTKFLAHAGVMDGLTLATLCQPAMRAATTPHLRAQIASGQPLPVGRELVAGMFFDHARMCRQLGVDAQAHRRFHSVEALVKAHDALAARVLAIRVASDVHYEFPAPPVPGTEEIVPITSVTELYNEAREQRNCLASFAEDVARGEIFLYRMLAPERATVSLRREGRVWNLDQVAASRNAPVSESAYASVAEWLGIDLPF